jgi:regulator of protease activity HflC (stomatin/prohibitin superfamily)
VIENLVDALLNNLQALVPVKVVYSYEQGVKFRRGVDIEQLEAGWHWYWPFVEHIELVNIQEEGVDLPLQTVTTKDGVEVTFSANVFFVVKSARLAFLGVQDLDHWISRRSASHLHRKVREWEYAELVSHQKDLETSLKETLSTRLKKYGVEIVSVELTDFVRTRAYRLLQSVQ